MRECEEKLKSVKKSLKVCNSAGPRDWLAAGKSPKRHMCEACREAEESRQLLHYRTKVLGWPGS